MAKKKLNVQVIISGFVDELISRLHAEHPHTEWSGIARIEKKDGYYLVSDIRFPKQSNKGAETEIKNGGLESLLEDIVTKHPEQLHEWKCRLHSHHTMGCFRSGTDAAAKASFNDGYQDFRWSIVTAYKGSAIAYKCALNVFKPVNIEFDVPVKAEEFDLNQYYAANMADYDVYMKAYKKLEEEKDASLSLAQQPYVPTPEHVNALINIFNVEDSEDNKQTCFNILEQNNKGKTKGNIDYINRIFDEQVEELLSYFGDDNFQLKIDELEKAIEVPTYTQYGGSYQGGAQHSYNMGGYPEILPGQKPLFGEDEIPADRPDRLGSLARNRYGDDRDY